MRPDPDPAPAVARVFQQEYPAAVATLIRLLGGIDAAEEAVQDAFVLAVEKWAQDGLPPNPGGWIVTTARRRAIDRFRRESGREARHAEAALLAQPDDPLEVGPVRDDQLRLIFTCCHPALAPDSRVALTLRLLGGLETPEIARAFLVPETTMAQRLVRAKRKIRAAGIPYRVPSESELPARLAAVLAVLYLVFNEGYRASSADTLLRMDLCEEAIRLARRLAELMPDEPEAVGLLALLLLLHSRRAARTDAAGEFVALTEQDRSRWDAPLAQEGLELVRRCLRRGAPGPYQVQAAINAVHADTATGADTDWRAVLALYDQLAVLAPTPVVALNRAVALAEVAGPQAALEAIGELELTSYQPFHVVRAELLARLGRSVDATAAYDAALDLTTNDVEYRHLCRRRAEAARG